VIDAGGIVATAIVGSAMAAIITSISVRQRMLNLRTPAMGSTAKEAFISVRALLISLSSFVMIGSLSKHEISP